MAKRQLLFVTYQDESFDEGLSYATELAKAMSEDIVLLMVRKKDTFSEKFDNLMAGVSFAEEGEHETAREMVAPKSEPASIGNNGKMTGAIVRAGKAGVHLASERTDRDVAAGIRHYLREHSGIDKVVLSPSVTESEVLTTRELNRLVRTASRPIVTMTRQACRSVGEASRCEKEGPYRRYETSAEYR